MFKVLGALTGSRNVKPLSQEEMTKKILKQAHDFEIALCAMDYVLDDRAEQGLALLKESEAKDGPDQTINVLARGVIEFLEATLGFEAEEMKKASATLAKAEQLSLKSRQTAQKMDIKSSSLYPPGTVYAVTYTESCLLHALLMLFNESILDGAKALLKLRKAYYMLQEIFQAIKKAEATKRTRNSSNDPSESDASFISAGAAFTCADIPYPLSAQEQEDHDIMESIEKVHKLRVKRLTGSHIGNTPAIYRLRKELGLKSISALSNNEDDQKVNELTNTMTEDIDFSQATIDEFIHSGVNLCYGILQVVLSLIPPAIGAVLSIVGFRGSREEGLRLVWKATRQRNVHGCIGLLGLMFYYDGPFQFTDDDFDIPVAKSSTPPATSGLSSSSSTSLKKTPTSNSVMMKTMTEDMDGPTLLHPGKILEEALLQSRALFPHSALWLLNEARMLSGKGRLKEAVQLMDSIDLETIHMRQVKTLMIFDRAITLVHLHEYDRAADDLLSLLDISSWSHALYHYFAGCCYLEKWRMHELGIKKLDNADEYKDKARKMIFGAPSFLGKKTFKSKNLPLDRFMLRKVEQFKDIQNKLKLKDPLDAIATSPVHELAYFYNGYNRMTKADLELTKKLLTEYHNPAVDAKNIDQELVKNLLLSLTLRRLGHIEEGCALLDNEVIPKFFTVENGKNKYVKKTEDPWLYPTALYERALFSWKLNGMNGLKESKEWLMRAQGYADDYELSTRVGMKIKAAIDRVDHSL